MSKVSVSEVKEYRKKRGSKNDGSIRTTTVTTEKILTPFQAQRVILIEKLRELVATGDSPIAIQSELGMSQ